MRRPPLGVAGDVAEHFPEPGGHEVVEDGVDGGAQVEAHPGDDVDVLVEVGVHVPPQHAVHVKGSPAEAEHDHQHTWMGRRDRLGGKDVTRAAEGD